MSVLGKLSVQAKMSLVLGVVVGALVALVVTAYLGLASVADSERILLRENFGNAHDLASFRSHQNGERMDEFVLVETPSGAWGPWTKDIGEREREVRTILNRLERRTTHNSLGLAKLRELEGLRDEFLKTRQSEILPRLRAGKLDEARQLILGIQMSQHLRIRALARELEASEAQEAKDRVAAAHTTVVALMVVFSVVGGGAIVGAGLLEIYLYRAVRTLPRFSRPALP